MRASSKYGMKALAALAVMTALPAHAQERRARIDPYVEVSQTFIADLKGGDGDVLTYTSAAVGADARIETTRAEGQLSVRYEHQFGWSSKSPDSDVLSGIARGRYAIVPETLNIEAGALATRVRTDGYEISGDSLVTAGNATTHVYSLYAGPTLTQSVGDVDVEAAYRIGYSRVEDDVNVSVGGSPILGVFDESVYHSAQVSVGMQPGPLPVGWSVSGAYEREDATELDQRYEEKRIRADVTVPVSRTVALVGGIGYEDVQISQRAALLDDEGNLVLNNKGRVVSDKSVPRLIAYDVDGIIWDAGVLWRPSRRTSLEARVGRRYDSTHYIGNFIWQPSPNSHVQITYFDRIDSFGRALHGNLIAVPNVGFDARRNPFSGDLAGCVTGQEGGACLNDALAAINGSNYRNRGLQGQYTFNGRRWNWGAGLGYSRRKFIAPDESIFAVVNGATDEYYFARLFGGVKLDMVSDLAATFYANRLDAGAGGIDVTNYGTYVSYHRLLGRRLSAQASLGLDAIDTSDIAEVISLLGQVGVRYLF